MKKNFFYYLKLVLILILVLFIVIYLAVTHLGKLHDVTPTGIAIVDDENNGSSFEVYSEGMTWKKINALNIFNNEKFDGDKIIAPESNGKYEFTIKNRSRRSVSYLISLEEDYNVDVNMKYRLIKNGKYVIGDEKNYVSIKELILKENKVLPDEKNTYVLEWSWNSTDKDTISGINGGYYSLELYIDTL